MKWQPIETAPKDGTAVLAVNEHGDMTTVLYARGAWQLCEWGDYAAYADWYPTHWMPLPDAPK